MLRTQHRCLLMMTFALMLLPTQSEASGRCVILLHGLARSHYSMAKLARDLQAHDYIVVNKDYPSRKKTITDIAHQEIPLMVDDCLKHHPDSLYFVTHSMGGVVLRQYLQEHPLPIKRIKIVMLGPPNHGSPWVDFFQRVWLFKVITGPAGQQLTTGKTSIPNRLTLSLPYPVGIIAGSFSFFPFAKWFFHEPNDGKVAVSSTQLAKMDDFVVLPVSHTFMMNNALVKAQILHFFDHGKFNH